MISDNGLIFISIASYRDPQLLPTVQDLLSKAHEPGLLRFGICWQHDRNEEQLPLAGDERFRVLDIDWRYSRGACWARSEIMKLWQHEQWFLQIDSHCRFVEGWDTKLIRMMGQTGSTKPILSTYANAFTPAESSANGREMLSGPPQLIAIETFTDKGIPKLKPLEIPGAANRNSPVKARFLAAGFLFAPGSFVEDVPYDPELYFFGEEISITLRAFTSGYDLFHPVENVAWHDYVRAYAVRHWEDHLEKSSKSIDKNPATWKELDSLSQKKVGHQLIGNPEEDYTASGTSPLRHLGLGSVRTRRDFEKYAGISFELRKLQDYTRYGLEPPNPPSPEDWPDHVHTWLVRVTVKIAELPCSALDDLSVWVVSIQDADRREIRRHDFQRAELDIPPEAFQAVVIVEIQSGIIPAFWSLRPYGRFGEGSIRLEGLLAEEDFSIVTD